MDEAVLSVQDDVKLVRQLVLDGSGDCPAKVYLFGSRKWSAARQRLECAFRPV